MSGEIEKFDPATLMQGVKDRIKSTFVSLIPDEQWEQMVKGEVDKFFKERETNYNYREYRSDFHILVRDELNAEAKKRLHEYLSGPEFTGVWQAHGQMIASEAVTKMFVENSGAILATMFAGMFQVQLDNFKNSLLSRQY